MTVQERYKAIIEWFEANMPVAESELNYRNPFELLVAVMLSAQCTDKRVNMVTPALFAAYPDAVAMAKATPEQIFSFIHSVSYPNAKAQHLVAMAQQLTERHNGQVPCDEDALVALSGVGRKTAHVIMAVLWNCPTMAVDTHIFRISERLGLTTNSKNVLQTERQLTKYIPAELIPKAHHWLLLHGRYVCTARKPHCEQCGIREFCRFYKK
ncbi:MAG: endonuclease III [Paludibacteraceae bacterium]|nr:endonuclease III [Paludibacteraceae bacterium]